MKSSVFLGQFRHNQAAAASAEFALVVPFFILLMFGTINGALMLAASNQLHYSAERAARCLSVDVSGTCTTGTIDGYAKGLYDGPLLSDLTFTPTEPACGNQVVGSGSYELITGLEATSYTLSATACYPKI